MRREIVLGLIALVAFAGRPASAIEFADRRVEIHGYYEAQIRSIVRDFEFSDDWDLTQWWNVLSLEFEWAVAPDGFGPFDTIDAFARVEVRYDCVWTGGCSFFDSADTYGYNSQRLPKRLSDARRSGWAGTQWIGDTRHFYDIPFKEISDTPNEARLRPSGSRKPLAFWQSPAGAPFFGSGSYGLDLIPAFDERGNLQSVDDPPLLYFEQMLRPHCDQWSARARPNGSSNGRGGMDILLLDPNCNYDTIGAAADKPNPFRAGDVNPITGQPGALALPFRPAPELAADSGASLRQGARGVYYPNARLQRLLDDGDLEPLPTKFRRSELAWNRGESQQDQKELKELYADIEMFDSRLWLRIGYQTIVWGKTELFRNQDQFNPQDVALASLTSLEESRISLWALRGVWSFYDVGPFNDVRLEMAVNFDQFQGTDVGSCGEPYTVLAACAITVGQLVHGYFGFGLAGQQRPPDPWNDSHGLEYGARFEFRWDRFSFAITDFYGFQDLPYVEGVFAYGRNVDPRTGRPRHTTSAGKCKTGKESACLGEDNALSGHHANQQLFAMVCANTVGISPTLDPSACFANVFNSPLRTPDVAPGTPGPRIVVALNFLLAGDTNVPTPGALLAQVGEWPLDGSVQAAIARNSYNGMLGKATVDLIRDPNDGDFPDYANASENNTIVGSDDFAGTVDTFLNLLGGSLSGRLTDWQESLLGCGPFLHTSCDLDGMDLLNAEASALIQSFPNIDGTFRGPDGQWDTTDRHIPQPGTVGFEGGPRCSRFAEGKTFILPGCRGPGDAGYNVAQDGSVTGALHPWTGQQFQNELAIFSWNLLMTLAALSVPPRDDGESAGPRNAPDRADFDVSDPFREGGCSFKEPQWCSSVAAFLALSGNRRNSVLAGGNGLYGRRDFVWHSGQMAVARWDKANILGFSMDFAEDVTKSNWGIEFTWVDDIHFGDNNAFSGVSESDAYRLSISVDRPTFVNFLNANRTFFFNMQWFMQYTDDWNYGFTSDGPWDVFGVFSVGTGYFQDRLLPSFTVVYFVMNNSLAFLPDVTYRFTENFQATFGIAAFMGREEERPMPLNEFATATQRFGRNAYKSSVENGLAVIRERDEIFLRIKYTF